MGPLLPMTIVTLLRVTMTGARFRLRLLVPSLWEESVTLVALVSMVLTLVEEFRLEMSILTLALLPKFLVVTLVTGR